MSGQHDHTKHVTPDTHDNPDVWHQHSAAERPQKAHLETLPTKLILMVGLAMFVGLVVTIVITYGYYTWYTARLLDQQEDKGPEEIAMAGDESAIQARDNAATSFQDYTWVPEVPNVIPKDTVQIPLKDAIKKVASRYASMKDSTTPTTPPTPLQPPK